MDRLNKKALYKLGDIIVFQELNRDSKSTKICQGRITKAYGLIEESDEEDILDWYYFTDADAEDCCDPIDEDQILYKIN